MLDPLYHLAANAIVFFHRGFAPIFGADSFFSWAFSVVLLVVCVRILIFPLFVKQVKSQRTMQMMQPRIKEIREKHGHDKPRMQQEMMALQREHGNPLLGCLPIFLQIPLFISLFHVFTHLAPMNEGPNHSLVWRPRVGLSADQVEQIASAKVFGISLASKFTSDGDFSHFLGVDSTHVRILAIVLIVLMGLTTFLTQRQIMARTGPLDPQQAMVQKALLYGSPLMLAFFGFRFPIAVLLYWLTTNLWSMGQQFFIMKKMPPIKPADANGRLPGARPAAGGAVTPARPAPGVRAGAKSKNRPRSASVTPTKGGDSGAAAAGRTSSTAPPGTRSRNGTSTASRTTTTPKAATTPKSGKAGAPGGPGANGVSGGGVSGGGVSDNGVSDNGVAATTAASTGRSAEAKTSAAGRRNAPGKNAGQSAASGPTAPSDGESTPRPAPVPAGVRRQVGGSRPAKRRGKSKRPGGRR